MTEDSSSRRSRARFPTRLRDASPLPISLLLAWQIVGPFKATKQNPPPNDRPRPTSKTTADPPNPHPESRLRTPSRKTSTTKPKPRPKDPLRTIHSFEVGATPAPSCADHKAPPVSLCRKNRAEKTCSCHFFRKRGRRRIDRDIRRKSSPSPSVY